jgi:D-sedoheptulose 7-phosphate isomerase
VYKSLSALEPQILVAARLCTEALASGRKLLICGNGGSAAEAQHLAGELMGRYKMERRPLPALALTADSVLLTCVGNDYCYEEVFARQLRALGQPGDVLIVFTTSGNSPNVLRALEAARQIRLPSISFLGKDGGKAKGLSDCALIVRHPETARAQEAHQFLMHALMDLIEDAIANEAIVDRPRSTAPPSAAKDAIGTDA